MEYALKERIGKPDLFTGRKKELAYFLKWIDNIKHEKSQSTALMARRKMGKTALMERLFNITFAKNNGIIPFYYEIKEVEMWVGDFCVDFFMTFVYQYIAFKTLNTDYLRAEDKTNFDKVKAVAAKEGLDYLTGFVEGVENAVRNDHVDILWGLVREAPQTIASRQNEYIVQMIDEFQFLNSMIYWDKGKNNVADTLAGGYLSTAESKIAPLMVSCPMISGPQGWGSEVMDILSVTLPARFKCKYLGTLPKKEVVEIHNIPTF